MSAGELSDAMWLALNTLAKYGPLHTDAVAGRSGSSSVTMNTLRALSRRGLVKWTQPRCVWSLTPAGRDLLERTYSL